MTDKKEIQLFNQDTKNVLEKTLTNLVEGLTGVATSSKNDLLLSISHTFQRMRGGQFLSTFLNEWNRYRDKGRVKEDYQNSEQHKVCLQELLDFLDNESPTEIRFDTIKKIFLVAATEEASDRNSLLPQQFIKIAKSLSDGEIILLSSVWKIFKSEEIDLETANLHAHGWIEIVSKDSGLKYKSLTEIHENSLIEKKLITPRKYGDGSGITIKPYFRLTDLGYELCNFIENYQENGA